MSILSPLFNRNGAKKDTSDKKYGGIVATGSAAIARDRLKIIIIEDRQRQFEEKQAILIDRMKQDILNVVQRYINVSPEDIEVKRTHQGESEVLELNINIHEKEIIDVALLEKTNA